MLCSSIIEAKEFNLENATKLRSVRDISLEHCLFYNGKMHPIYKYDISESLSHL